MNENEENQKHIALVFSIIFPGAGFFHQKKWLSGMKYMVIHLLLFGVFLYSFIATIHDSLHTGTIDSFSATISIFVLIGILINWVFNIRATQDYE